MTDERLIQAIQDYRRGAIRVYDGPAGSPPRWGKMPEEYKADLFERIKHEIGVRSGRLVCEKVVYSVEGDRIKESVWFG